MVSHYETNSYHNSKHMFVTTQNKPIFIKNVNKSTKKGLNVLVQSFFYFMLLSVNFNSKINKLV